MQLRVIETSPARGTPCIPGSTWGIPKMCKRGLQDTVPVAKQFAHKPQIWAHLRIGHCKLLDLSNQLGPRSEPLLREERYLTSKLIILGITNRSQRDTTFGLLKSSASQRVGGHEPQQKTGSLHGAQFGFQGIPSVGCLSEGGLTLSCFLAQV